MLKTIAGLQGVTVLSKDAQKKVTGSQGTCSVYLPAGSKLNGFSWSASSLTYYKEDGHMTIEGVSRDEADKFMAANGGRWCCTSCGSASWL
jgi:hypothetical protein